ncbi:MAG: peptidase MA family metallohydrolase [Chloroflexota bacterium]
MRRTAAILVAALLLSSVVSTTIASRPVAAADPAFGTPTATAKYGDGVTFSQPLTPVAGIRRVEILLSVPGSIGPLAVQVPRPDCCARVTLRHVLAEEDGHLVPNTRFSARWRVTSDNGATILGDEASVVYADTRFDWKSVSGPIVRVHWYKGPLAFGKRALAIGEAGVDNAASLLGVTESEPVDFYIYADKAEFYEALGPGTRENVGGEAHADIRTMFALISPDDIEATWVSVVVPHELTHLVFDTAVKNPYHGPPRWLNEGLAVYLSEGYTDAWRAAVEDAVRSDSVIPLDGLGGQFPTTREQFFLAYGESVAAVDFLVRRHGKDALVKLVRSYQDGVTDDEAFTAGIGQDLGAFQTAWFADLGARAPGAVGPQIGPAGPLPPGWAAQPGAPAPGATGRPAASGGPNASGVKPAGNDGLDPALAGLVVVGLAVIVVAVRLVVRSRRRSLDHVS